MAQVPLVNEMEDALTWIGFTVQAQRTALLGDLANFTEFSELNKKDISDLAESYGKRTVADGKFIFGLQRTKRLKAMIHWVQDFERVSEAPTTAGLVQNSFREQLVTAANRAEIRKIEAASSASVSSKASPGKLKDKRKWNNWVVGLENMFSSIPGVRGVPLIYVIRDNENPEPDGHDTFVQKCIACAPLNGPHFEADARRVHQLITSFVQGETSEQWIKMNAQKQNGRRDWLALSAHYKGEGNTSCRIAEADRLRDTLHYKSERALAFTTFLSRVQHMFNLYEEEHEPYTKAQKLRFLLDKTTHPSLTLAVSALRLSHDMGEDNMFTKAANHLSAAVSKMPEYASKQQQVSAVTFEATASSESDIYRNGKIYTGYYKNWFKLSKADQEAVNAKRTQLGIKKQSTRKPKTGQGGDKKKLVSARKQLAKAKRQVAALRKERSGSESDISKDDTPEDTGNEFGGQAEQSRRKKKSKA